MGDLHRTLILVTAPFVVTCYDGPGNQCSFCGAYRAHGHTAPGMPAQGCVQQHSKHLQEAEQTGRGLWRRLAGRPAAEVGTLQSLSPGDTLDCTVLSLGHPPPQESPGAQEEGGWKWRSSCFLQSGPSPGHDPGEGGTLPGSLVGLEWSACCPPLREPSPACPFLTQISVLLHSLAVQSAATAWVLASSTFLE